MTLYAMIENMEIFKNFSDDEKKRVCQIGHSLVEFKRGDIIIKEGKQFKSIYLLLKGSALITKKSNSATIRLSKLTSGEIFGEMSFFSDKPRRTTVVANSDALVMKMDEDFFQKLNPELQNKIKDHLISILINRLDYMNDSIINISRSLRH